MNGPYEVLCFDMQQTSYRINKKCLNTVLLGFDYPENFIQLINYIHTKGTLAISDKNQDLKKNIKIGNSLE